jgi:hypothetical protein
MISASELGRGLLAALVVSLAAHPANAKPAGDEAELDSHTRTAARSLAAQGTAAFEAQKYAEALDHFERAAALVEAPTILLMQARTLVQLGRWVEGADKYASVQRWRDAHPAEQTANPTFAQASDAAAQELAQLMPRIPKLNVQVSTPQKDEKFEVHVDNRRVLDALVGADIPVDPGPHTIEVRAADGKTVVREIALSEGRREEVMILLDDGPPPPKVVAAPPPVAKPAVQESSGGSTRETLGWVFLGTGAAAATFGTVAGIVALGKKSDLDEVCSPGCPPSQEDTLDSYRMNRTISYVGFAIGAAGVASGAYLLLSGTEEKPALGLSVEPAGARLWGTF